MKRLNWQIILALSLILLSAVLYLIQYAIFRDAHHIFIYMVGDIAFLPVEVLLVTLIIERLLKQREKRILLNKLNMVIGAFFSEVGISLLKSFSSYDSRSEGIRKELVVTSQWSNQRFTTIGKLFKNYDCKVEAKQDNLEELKDFLVERRNFLLRLLENPGLLEHESFTELLWAVFHLTEELSYRTDMKGLPDTDCEHLANDIKRVYLLLLGKWLAYMRHLRDNYPYLFSLAMRTNPFDPNVSVEVR